MHVMLIGQMVADWNSGRAAGLKAIAAISILLVSVIPTAADPVLAPKGQLRAAYIGPNVAQGRVDPQTGAVTGVAAEITRELGKRNNVPTSIVPLPTAAAVLEAVRSGQADIGFVAPNPERAGVVLYSSVYMTVGQSALVLEDSKLRSVSEIDRAGHVVGINTDDSVGVWLKGRLKEATLKETPDYSLRDAVQWLRSGEVVGFAGGRSRLAEGVKDVQGLRMLDDNFYSVPQSIAVPLQDEKRLSLINAALQEFRSTGQLADWLARSKVEGLSVAP